MKIYILHITLFFCGLLLINSPISAQVLLPQYSMWEGFVFDSQQAEQIGALLAKAEQNNATKYKDKGTPCKVLVVTEW